MPMYSKCVANIILIIFSVSFYSYANPGSDEVITINMVGSFEDTENPFTIEGKVGAAIDKAFMNKYPNIEFRKPVFLYWSRV